MSAQPKSPKDGLARSPKAINAPRRRASLHDAASLSHPRPTAPDLGTRGVVGAMRASRSLQAVYPQPATVGMLLEAAGGTSASSASMPLVSAVLPARPSPQPSSAGRGQPLAQPSGTPADGATSLPSGSRQGSLASASALPAGPQVARSASLGKQGHESPDEQLSVAPAQPAASLGGQPEGPQQAMPPLHARETNELPPPHDRVWGSPQHASAARHGDGSPVAAEQPAAPFASARLDGLAGGSPSPALPPLRQAAPARGGTPPVDGGPVPASPMAHAHFEPQTAVRLARSAESAQFGRAGSGALLGGAHRPLTAPAPTAPAVPDATASELSSWPGGGRVELLDGVSAPNSVGAMAQRLVYGALAGSVSEAAFCAKLLDSPPFRPASRKQRAFYAALCASLRQVGRLLEKALGEAEAAAAARRRAERSAQAAALEGAAASAARAFAAARAPQQARKQRVAVQRTAVLKAKGRDVGCQAGEPGGVAASAPRGAHGSKEEGADLGGGAQWQPPGNSAAAVRQRSAASLEEGESGPSEAGREDREGRQEKGADDLLAQLQTLLGRAAGHCLFVSHGRPHDRLFRFAPCTPPAGGSRSLGPPPDEAAAELSGGAKAAGRVAQRQLTVSSARGAVGLAFRSRSAALLPHAAQDPTYEPSVDLCAEGGASLVAVPLLPPQPAAPAMAASGSSAADSRRESVSSVATVPASIGTSRHGGSLAHASRQSSTLSGLSSTDGWRQHAQHRLGVHALAQPVAVVQLSSAPGASGGFSADDVRLLERCAAISTLTLGPALAMLQPRPLADAALSATATATALAAALREQTLAASDGGAEGEGPVAGLLHAALARASTELGAATAELYLFDRATGTLSLRTAANNGRGSSRAAARHAAVALDELHAESAVSAAAMSASAVLYDSRTAPISVLQLVGGDANAKPRCAIAAPVLHSDHSVHAVLQLVNKRGRSGADEWHAFDEQDLRTLALYAAVTTMAIDTAIARQELARAGAADENVGDDREPLSGGDSALASSTSSTPGKDAEALSMMGNQKAAVYLSKALLGNTRMTDAAGGGSEDHDDS